jgi:hypothetical protein
MYLKCLFVMLKSWHSSFISLFIVDFILIGVRIMSMTMISQTAIYAARLPQANRPIQGRGHWRSPVTPHHKDQLGRD